VCNGLDDDGDGLVDEGLEDSCGGRGRTWGTEVVTSYPVTATWMFPRGDACA